MQLDSFVAAHQEEWDRLAALSARAQRRARRLSPDEVEELVSRYQRVASQLSYARSRFPDPALIARLTRLVATSSAAIYGTRPRTMAAIGGFFSDTFPRAVWERGRFVAAAAALLLIPALMVGSWLATSSEAVDASGPAALREAYVEQDFEAYYSSTPATEFSSRVTVNNIQVAFLAFAGGIAVCVPTALVLVVNGANVGAAAGLFVAAGQSPKFFGLIAPHGLLEVTAVIVAAAAGLALGWSVIDPGAQTRRAAVAAEGRRAVSIVLGLMVAFLVAGIIEGFVTGSPLPTPVRVGIGVLVEVAFVGYIVVFGRRPVTDDRSSSP